MRNILNLFLATSNAKKIKELKAQCEERLCNVAQIKEGCDLTILSCADFDNYEEPIEDGVTYKENALIKAYAAARISGYCSIADDSGLIVEMMGRAPGVLSARWSGEAKDEHANRKLLLQQLKDVPFVHRRAFFSTCVACVIPQDSLLGNVIKRVLEENKEAGSSYDKKYECIVEKCIDGTCFYEMSFMGTMHGYILCDEQGESGFGYDSIFAPNKLNSELNDDVYHNEYSNSYFSKCPNKCCNESDRYEGDEKLNLTPNTPHTPHTPNTSRAMYGNELQLITCAQITLEQKNAISHRAEAFSQLLSVLVPLILKVSEE